MKRLLPAQIGGKARLPDNVCNRFSLLLTTEPQFPQEEPVDLYSPPLLPPEKSKSSQASNLLDFEEYGICKNVSRLLLEIRYLSRFFPTPTDDIAPYVLEDFDIHSSVCSILQRLLQTKLDVYPGSHGARITECCRFAAAIFLFFLFKNHYPDPTILINSLVHRLQTALDSIITCSLDGSHRLLVWLLSVGGAAALNLPAERDWFVSYLAESAAELELASWDEVKRCLQMVIWIDAMDDYPFHQLWEEVLTNVTRMTTQDPFCAIWN